VSNSILKPGKCPRSNFPWTLNLCLWCVWK
jgi:hypothetical protein